VLYIHEISSHTLSGTKELDVEVSATDGVIPGPIQVGAVPMSEAGGARENRRSILLVDDDSFIQDAVGSMLHFLGFDPVVASTGEEALARLAAGLQPALVILDMDMPGLGGAGTLPQLRVMRPSLPVLIATGRVNETVLELTRRYRQVGLMPKPFDLRELQRHLG
jgi:CheY-like chemotaxis protein